MQITGGWYCHTCLADLSDEERKYYGDRCGDCEAAWNARVEAWRRGAEDCDLSRLLREPPLPAKH